MTERKAKRRKKAGAAPREEYRRRTNLGRPSQIYEAGPFIIDSLRNGATHESACELAGIPYKTFRTWLWEGHLGVEPYKQFRADVQRATAEARESVERFVYIGAITDPKMALDWLKVRGGPDWRPKVTISVDTLRDEAYRLALEQGMEEAEARAFADETAGQIEEG